MGITISTNGIKNTVLIKSIHQALKKSETWKEDKADDDTPIFTHKAGQYKDKAYMYFKLSSTKNEYLFIRFTTDSESIEVENIYIGKMLSFLLNHFSDDIKKITVSA